MLKNNNTTTTGDEPPPDLSGNRQIDEARSLRLDRDDPYKSAGALVRRDLLYNGLRRLHHHKRIWWYWDDGHYQEVSEDELKARLWKFLDGAECAVRDKEGETVWVHFKPNRGNVGNVFDALTAKCQLPDSIDIPLWLGDSAAYPPPDELLVVGNGLLHIPSQRLFAPTPALLSPQWSGVPFDPNAVCPEWLGFLNQIFVDDAEGLSLLQEWFGYMLTPDTSLQKIMMIVGPGRGGKGTIGRVLTELVGRQGVANPTLASLSKDFGLQPLIGKSVAIISDARFSSRSDPAVTAERLLSISGEDEMQVDRKFKGPWKGRLTTRFTILTNELPKLKDASGALLNRFNIITLTQSFLGKEDPALFEKRLRPELSGILNWAIDGYVRLNNRRYFEQPTSSRHSIEMLQAMSAPVKAFVADVCILDSSHEQPKDELYRAWARWCGHNGVADPGQQTFYRDLTAAFPALRTCKPRISSKQTPCYAGIRVAPEEDRKFGPWKGKGN